MEAKRRKRGSHVHRKYTKATNQQKQKISRRGLMSADGAAFVFLKADPTQQYESLAFCDKGMSLDV